MSRYTRSYGPGEDDRLLVDRLEAMHRRRGRTGSRRSEPSVSARLDVWRAKAWVLRTKRPTA